MNNSSTPTSPRSVAVIGGCGIGLTLKADRIPDAGETVGGATFSVGEGGKGSNQAIAICRLGVASALYSIVGRDANADRLRRLWLAEGVDDRSVRIGELATMVGAILVEGSGENRIIVAPGALAELDGPALDAVADRLASADALLASLEVPTSAVAAALGHAHRAGMPCLLNPAPAVALPPETMAMIDHLLPNRSEAATLASVPPGAPPESLVEALRRAFAGTIVLTLGEDGALVDDGSRREHIAALPVDKVVDTTGAGDAFAAAYTVAIVEGAEPVEAARFAAAAGAFTVTRDEVIPALPRRSELETPFGSVARV